MTEPVLVLVPVKIRVPAPTLLKIAEPETMPANTADGTVLATLTRLLVPANATVPLNKSGLAPARVMLELFSVKALVTRTPPETLACRVPAVKVVAPVPRAVPEPRFNVPPLMLIAPVTLLAAGSVKVPPPPIVKPPVPVMLELMVRLPLLVVMAPSTAPRATTGTDTVSPVAPPVAATTPVVFVNVIPTVLAAALMLMLSPTISKEFTDWLAVSAVEAVAM